MEMQDIHPEEEEKKDERAGGLTVETKNEGKMKTCTSVSIAHLIFE